MVKPTTDTLRLSGGLTDTFIHCDTCLSDEEFNALRHQEFIEKENQILLGQPGGSVDGVIERGGAATGVQSKQAKTRKNKERQTAQITELIEQVRASLQRMEADIKALEEKFQARDGEEWREKLALQILDEDEIPQRNPDESMADYRERLEAHLINEMLNPDGSIKNEYKDHPEYGDYAQWAQKQNNLNNAKALVVE